MLNLEELDLNLKLDRSEGFIDGNHFKENIICYMPRLKILKFNIRIFNDFCKQINLPSNKDIQNTFKDLTHIQGISYVGFCRKKQFRYFHIYSYPYTKKYYDNISNNFPSGSFNSVRGVSLYDEQPFEYEFFLRIQKAFPCMKELTVINNKPQKNRLYIKSKNDNQDLLIIKFPNLTRLTLVEAHDDYVELFLVDTIMHFTHTVTLTVDYETIKRVTNDFTRNETRINCTKLRYLRLFGVPEITKHIKDYCPQTNIMIC